MRKALEQTIGKNIPLDTFLNIISELEIQFIVIDAETDQILYANEKMNHSYNVDYNVAGKRCWEVYQTDKTGHCEFCPVAELKRDPSKTIVWETFNTLTNRWFRNTSRLTEWADGRLVHIEQGVEITESKELSMLLQQRLDQQLLMSQISQSFISTENILSKIRNALKSVGEFLRADSLFLTNIDEENQYFRCCWLAQNQAEFSWPDISIIRQNFWADALGHSLSSKSESPAFLSVPVWSGNTLWGALNIEMTSSARSWSESDIYLAKMLSNVIGGVLIREHMNLDVAEAEERTYSMLNALPIACTLFDENYRPIDCNEAALTILGLSGKDEYLKNYFSFSPEYQPDGSKSAAKLRSVLRKSFLSGHESFECLRRRKDGGIIPMEIIMVRIKWKSGYRVAVYTRDLTTLKSQLAEIERTKVLAEESSKAKSNFLANMSHEIRTPMNAIIGMTELALKSSDQNRIKYCLDKVSDAASHLLGIINDILDKSKIDAGKFELSAVDFLMEKMLQRVSDITSFRAEQKRQNFFLLVDKNVPAAIIADQQRLAQVLTNLLSNAVKFTPDDGKVSLLVHNIDDKENSCTLLFEVIDTGIGLTPEQQAKLFQSFEQADGSISRRFGGTGLGLAICKDIIELMGGIIGVDSAISAGSRFYFSVTVPKGISEYKNKIPPNIDWQNLSVLIVDDSPEILESFRNVAASAGFFAQLTESAEEALSFLSKNKFDIIFIDWILPTASGFELAKQIHESYAGQLIVIMSPIAELGQIESSAAEIGIDHFISKPPFPSQIIDCITECICGPTEEQSPISISSDEQFSGKCILLAEDIEINREILIASLGSTDLQIDCAENGGDACKLFSCSPDKYDLILMDIHMPEVDGYEATQRIRAMDFSKAQSVPIIAMTANVFQEDIQRCLSSGMNDHIGKPIDFDELMKKLNKYLK